MNEFFDAAGAVYNDEAGDDFDCDACVEGADDFVCMACAAKKKDGSTKDLKEFCEDST